MWAVAILVYIVCSVLAYGTAKGDCLNVFEYYRDRGEFEEQDKYIFIDEAVCWMMGLLGPMGLMLSFMCHFAFGIVDGNKKFRLCFRMPKEFCS